MRYSRLCAAALLLVVASVSVAEAGPFARLFGRRCSGGSCGAASVQASCQQSGGCSSGSCGAAVQSFHASASASVSMTADPACGAWAGGQCSLGGQNDALAEVNAERARRGLRPFLRDPLLTAGAAACATARAARRLAGHTSNDFGYLPRGAQARAGGCAAWPVGSGWGSCCTYENWTYAGAAYAIGADGKRYMSLFVR